MLITIRLIPAFIFFFLTIMSGQSLAADKVSLTKAIKTYKSGYSACVEAHRIRGSNLNAAKDKMAFYSSKLKEAEAIDSRIMSTTEQNVDRNITQCKTAKEDILRAEAFPIIEKAFNECNKSKNQLSSGQISSAESSFKKYTRFKSQAFELTSSLEKQPGTKAKIRRCDKTGEKLKLALNDVKSIVKTAEQQNSKAMQALSSCRSGQSKFKGKPPGKQSINEAKNKLSESLTITKGINFNINSAGANSKYGVLPIHKTVQASLSETKKCQNSLKYSINQNQKALSDQQLAKTAAAIKAQEQKLLKDKAEKELADKKLADKLKLEQKLVEKQKQDALILEQEKKRKEALAKADAIKKQKTNEEALKQAQKAEEKAKKEAARKNSSSDWRNLVDDKASDSSKSQKSSSSSKKSWTNLAPINKN